MKECSKCLLVLPVYEFSVVVDKRPGKECVYLHNVCKKCVCKKAMEYYNKKKNDPDFKKKNRERVKKWSTENKEYVAEKRKEVRKSDEYKEYVKAYYEKNHDKIRHQASKTNDKYIREQRAKITDKYAIILLMHPRNGLTRDVITKDMIEMKKIEIAIDRLKRLIKKNEQKN